MCCRRPTTPPFSRRSFSRTRLLATLIQPAGDNAAARLAALPAVSVRVREAFLDVYGRMPDAEEAAKAEAFLNERGDKSAEDVRDLLWALMTSAEFLTLP